MTMQKKNTITSAIKFGFLLMSLLCLSLFVNAQTVPGLETKNSFPSLLSNSDFYLIICAVALLLLMIVVLGKTSVSLSKVAANMNKKSSATIVFLVLMTASAFAQSEQVATEKPVAYFPAWALDPNVYVLGFLFSIMLFALYAVYTANMSLLKYISPEETVMVSPEVKVLKAKPHFLRKMYKRLAGGVPIAEEKDILLDHDYDGIKELDNKLPPWWIYGFYLTILFAVVYLFIYQLSGIGKLSHEEYQAELLQAEKQKEERLKMNMDNVNEANVITLADAEALSKGKEAFIKFCSACHRPDAGGQVGPNLTDEYWLHGGGIKNVFKTITYGVPEKGMISWKAQLSAKQIQQVGSYILSLKGSNPAAPKEPQGDIWVEETAPQTDSLKTASHTSATILLTR
jgi:cytochrome c oxidase cbb3-type subunit III